MKIPYNRIIFLFSVFIVVFLLLINQRLHQNVGRGLMTAIKDETPFTKEEQQWLQSRGELVYGLSEELFPLEGWDSTNNKPTGIIPDLLTEIERFTDTRILIKPYSPDQIFPAIQNNEIDFCIFAPTVTMEKNYLFSYPFLQVRGIVLKRLSSETTPSRINFLQQDSFFTREETKELFTPGETFSTWKEGFNLTINSEEEGITGWEPVILRQLEQKDVSEHFDPLPIYEYKTHLVFAVNRKNVILYHILNKTIHNSSLEDRLVLLQRRWFGLSLPLVRENISERITIIIIILSMSLIIIFYFFYSSHKGVYKELKFRSDEILDNKENLQIIFDSLKALILVINEEGIITNSNQAFCSFAGLPKSDCIGKTFTQIDSLPSLMKEKISSLFKERNSSFSSETLSSEHLQIWEKGRAFLFSGMPLKQKQESSREVLILINDVTQQKLSERQLLQNNKMAAIGQLAAGVAHEIRNPLALVRNSCYILEELSARESPIVKEKQFALINKALNKANGIINNLLNFSRISDEKWEAVNMDEIINMIILFHKNDLKKQNISTKIDCCKESCLIHKEAIEIILMNLIANAIDSMQNGGTLSLCCLMHKNGLLFQCRDTGDGIPKRI